MREIAYQPGARVPIRDEYLPKMRDGRKCTTIRRGKIIAPIGGTLVFKSGSTELPFRVVSITYKSMADLSDVDAQRDGFDSKDILERELARYYNELSSSDLMTILEFELTL